MLLLAYTATCLFMERIIAYHILCTYDRREIFTINYLSLRWFKLVYLVYILPITEKSLVISSRFNINLILAFGNCSFMFSTHFALVDLFFG